MSATARRWSVQTGLRGQRPVEHRVLARELNIGRDRDCEVVLAGPDVSRRHLVVWADGESAWVRDLSTNGSTCDGQPLGPEPRPLSPSAQLEVGSFALRVRLLSESGEDLAAASGEHAVPDAGPELDRRQRARQLLLERLELDALDASEIASEKMRPRVERALSRIWAELCEGQVDASQRDRWLSEMADEALGLGPLEPLLSDPSVSEIMVVDRETIYVERAGRIGLCDAQFTDDMALRAAIERIVTPLGRRIDVASPMVDARLRDGSRVNAVIDPIALRGPCLTIRRFPTRRLTLDDLLEREALSEPMGRFLRRCVAARKNIVIAGGTGSGKTTLLNVLSAFIGETERVVTIEDAAELSLAQPHVVPLEARPATAEGTGAIRIRDLVKNALRMRPDRIVVGECRGGEALDMLQAMNTGHDGSMTTTHANTPRDALYRLEILCLLSGVDVTAASLRRQIAASVDLVVQLNRGPDGTRRVTDIAEVREFDEQRGAIELRSVFQFCATGSDGEGRVQGRFRPTGYLPSFLGEFVRLGLCSEEDAL